MSKKLNCDYELDLKPRGLDHFPRFKRWLVMNPPHLLRMFLLRYWRGWMIENELYYTLGDEIQKEIDNEIIKDIMAELKTGKYDYEQDT